MGGGSSWIPISELFLGQLSSQIWYVFLLFYYFFFILPVSFHEIMRIVIKNTSETFIQLHSGSRSLLF